MLALPVTPVDSLILSAHNPTQSLLNLLPSCCSCLSICIGTTFPHHFIHAPPPPYMDSVCMYKTRIGNVAIHSATTFCLLFMSFNIVCSPTACKIFSVCGYTRPPFPIPLCFILDVSLANSTGYPSRYTRLVTVSTHILDP